MFKKLAMMFPFTFLGMDAKRVTPLTRLERKESRIQLEIKSHIEKNNRSLEDEYNLIKEKKSVLSRRCREFIINHFSK